MTTSGFGSVGEKPILTAGKELGVVRALIDRHGLEYSANDVIDMILEKAGK
ncbi:MAG: hypothetical protein ABIH34_07545 [Nanoarchaeota archaeon]